MQVLEKIKTGAYWNIIGFVIRFIIGLGSSILFVRLLGQHDYGIVTFIMSCVFFSGILVNLGMGTVMTQSIATWKANNSNGPLFSMLKQITGMRMIVILLIGAVFINSEKLSQLFDKPYLSPYLYLIPLIIITSYFQGTFKTLLTCYYEQKFINIASILEMLLKLVFVILGVVFGYPIIGFLLAIMASQVINGFQLAYRSYKKIFRQLETSTEIFRIKKHIRLAYHSFMVSISIRLLGRESDLFLLGILHPDIKQVAIYAVIFGIPKMIFEAFHHIIGGGLGLAAFTEQVRRGRLDDLRYSYYQLLKYFSLLLFPAMIGGTLLGGHIAVFMYGSEYEGLSIPLAVLFCALGFSAINSITTDLLYALDRGNHLMKSRVGFGVLNIVINIAVIPQYGALGVAVTTGLISVGATLVELYLVHQALRPRYPLFHWTGYWLSAFLMGITVYWVSLDFYWEIIIGMICYGLLVGSQELFLRKGVI